MNISEQLNHRVFSFTVVTVSFNNVTTIRETIESVLAQTHPDIEYIIVDGASTDGTVDIIKEYGDRITWISEPDRGLYFAMNKGWKMATGEYLGYLNADDFFNRNDVIESMVRELRVNPQIFAFYGDLAYVKADDTSKIVRYWKAGSYWRYSFLFGWMPPHPTFYAKRLAIKAVNGFRAQEFKSAADYQLMLGLLYKERIPAHYIPILMVRMRVGGISNSSFKNRLRALREDRRAWKVYGLICWFPTLILKPLRKIYQYFYRPKDENIL